MGWESHHSRSTHPRHLGQHSANLSPATPMCLLSSPDSDLFLSAQGAGFNRPYTLNNYHRVRSVAAYLIHIIRLMELTSLRNVELEEIKKAGECWANYRGPHRRRRAGKAAAFCFTNVAKN